MKKCGLALVMALVAVLGATAQAQAQEIKIFTSDQQQVAVRSLPAGWEVVASNREARKPGQTGIFYNKEAGAWLPPNGDGNSLWGVPVDKAGGGNVLRSPDGAGVTALTISGKYDSAEEVLQVLQEKLPNVGDGAPVSIGTSVWFLADPKSQGAGEIVELLPSPTGSSWLALTYLGKVDAIKNAFHAFAGQ